jgi:antirestriction protein ArdC/ankyrin repeat protein
MSIHALYVPNQKDRELFDSISVQSAYGVGHAIKDGANVNARTYRGLTPLHTAAGQPLVVERLLEREADPNAANDSGRTPLHSAVSDPETAPPARRDVLTALIKAGADPNARDHQDQTPLHDAATLPRETATPVRLLLDAGADPSVRDCLANTPLHYAAAHSAQGRNQAVGHLLDAGADPNLQNGAGNTPLHMAVAFGGDGQAQTIARLIEADTDLTLRNSDGQTPLELAAASKNPVAQTLLEQRAAVDARPQLSLDSQAERPRDLVTAYHRAVSTYLAKHAEAGTAPWQRSYKPGQQALPQSLATGREYQGGNSLYLMTVARDNGYSDPRWATFDQIKAGGGVVRKGEKSTKIVWWDFSKANDKVPLTDREGNAVLDDKGQTVLHHQGPRFRLYSVFNVEQARNLTLQSLPHKPSWQAHRDADSLIKAAGVTIEHTQTSFSYYDPKTDTAGIPSPGYFRDPESYYHNANHELAHATGHESRMNRETFREAREAGPGSSAGERDNLRAEIAAMMTNTRLGLGHCPIHASWTESSAKIISENPMEFHLAAREAQKMSDHLIAPIRQQQLPAHEQQLDPEQADRVAPAPARAAQSLGERMTAYRRSIPADHIEIEARPTTDRPNGPIDYNYQGQAIPQDLQGLAKKDFGYNQVIAHAPAAELQNHLRSLPQAERLTLETGPVR